MLASPILKLRPFDPDSFSTSGAATAVRLAPRAVSEATSSFDEFEIANDNPRTLEEELGSRLSSALWEFSKLAMHFTPEFRDRTIKQLRNLFDPEDWDEGDALPDQRSFKSFARAMALLQPQSRPMLGLSENGNILAMWAGKDGRVSFEHLPVDRLRWYVSGGSGKEAEAAAGVSPVLRLTELVNAHGMRALLDGEG